MDDRELEIVSVAARCKDSDKRRYGVDVLITSGLHIDASIVYEWTNGQTVGTLTDYYTNNMDLRGCKHNGPTNAQPPHIERPCPGQTTYTLYSIPTIPYWLDLATGLSANNRNILPCFELCRIIASSRSTPSFHCYNLYRNT